MGMQRVIEVDNIHLWLDVVAVIVVQKLIHDYKISYQDVEEVSSDIDTDNNSEVG